MQYYIDKSAKKTIGEIANQQFSDKVPNRVSLGSNKKHVWYKIELKNYTDDVKELFLHMKNAYINSKVGIYEFNGSILRKHTSYDIYNDDNIAKFFYGSTLRYRFILDTNSQKTIYIKLVNDYRQFSNIVIYDSYNSIVDFTKNNLLSFVLASILLILSIYHVVLYFISRYIEYIYYSFALFFAVIFQSRELGIAANFGFHGLTPLIVSSVALIMFIIFLLLFAMSVFELKNYKKFNIAFKTVIVLLGLNLLFLFTPMYKEAVVFIANVALTAVILQATLAVYMYIKKHPLARHYIAANIFYIVFSAVALLFYEGMIPYNEISFRSLSFGCVIEAVIFAYMLSYMISLRIKALEEKNLQQQEKIIKKSEKEQLGDMISIIAHQMKQPLNVISVGVANFELSNMMNQEMSKDEYNELISAISKQVSFATNTIDEFRHFFNPKKKAEFIDLSYPIFIASELMKSTLKDNGVKFVKDIDLHTKIKTFSNKIVHVLLNLIKNSNEHFDELQEDKVIKIIANEDENNAYIHVKDNAGGIPKEIIDKIFDQYFSTKSEKEGSGLGLGICKKIIEDTCMGTLSVKNEDNGVVFTIRLPKTSV